MPRQNIAPGGEANLVGELRGGRQRVVVEGVQDRVFRPGCFVVVEAPPQSLRPRANFTVTSNSIQQAGRSAEALLEANIEQTHCHPRHMVDFL